ncbi:MAG: DUF4412 domain-containing protein [Flavobacteriaceae bacterium]|nr:DUF4412 domain-containing protein [Flavobacteriaceae bacterium]
MNRIVYFLCISIFVSVSAEAQVLKKLGKRVKERTEKKATQRVEKKADQKVDKGLDGVFESNSSKKKQNSPRNGSNAFTPQNSRSSSTSKAEPAKTYTFDYLMRVEINVANQEKMQTSYLLSASNNYHAMQMTDMMPEGQDISAVAITDFEKKASFQLIEAQGQKMLMAISLDQETNEEIEEADFSIEKIPSKQILDYACEGLKIWNDEMQMKVYFTQEAGAGFSFFQDPNQSKMLPKYKEFENLMNDETLILEMQMEDYKNEENMTWRSLSIEPTQVKLNTEGYKRM